MMPKKMKSSGQKDLFRSRLEQMINRKHPLCKLADEIDLGVEFGVQKVGRPGLPIRLVVGIHYLKYTYNESDESVVERFLENPYWRYFCGYEYFQHEFPLEPSSLVRWRNRVGAEGTEKLLKETIESAKRKKLVREQEVKRVNVDTTVQEKAIAFPTDGRLYHKM
jgi:transposase, IS4 family